MLKMITFSDEYKLSYQNEQKQIDDAKIIFFRHQFASKLKTNLCRHFFLFCRSTNKDALVVKLK